MALTLVGCALVLGAAAAVATLRVSAVHAGPVAALAAQGAVVELTGRVVSDPRVVSGPYGDQVVVRLEAHEVTGRGVDHQLAAPVLVLGEPAWAEVALGATVRTSGRLVPADDVDLAALLVSPDDPETVAAPGALWRGADRLRTAVREAVAHRPETQRVLVPALVDGDDAGLAPEVVEEFRVTGLTHLTAVSGTNLTLVVGFVLLVARWVGVRGRWLYLVGGCGVVGFVVLARTEPSVLRAAVMGTVGLLAMGLNGRDRALRALGIAVVALVLAQPPLAAAPGFALSVLATAGIVLVGPGLREALRAWVPSGVAEAIAVPTAAQLACTPVVAAISGQVSLVAVAANLVVAPVVAPATVLGLLGGLVGLASTGASRLLGTPAAWCVAWIAAVAHAGAALPLPALGWGTGAGAVAVLTALTLAVALAAPFVLRRRWSALGVGAVLVVVVLARLPVVAWPARGWPPPGWAMVMCDVGQGDALVLRAAATAAVVVDAGPDPATVDACLDRLGVEAVPLVVLTHFHADHVDGLPGVLEDRSTGRVMTTRVLDPPSGVAEVVRDTRDLGELAAPAPAPYGRTATVGDVVLQVLWPEPGPVVEGAGDGSSANDASVVLLAEVNGVRMLLTGDVEPPAQARLAAALAGLQVDVLKVPHHGSRYQDLDWLTSLGAEQALVSVGEDNDYGHPAATTLDALSGAGSEVHRTDLEGDLAVTVEGGQVHVVAR